MNVYAKKKNDPVFLVHRFDESETELYHYGVPGMKWGVRRTPEELGHPNRTRKEQGDYALKRYRSPAMREAANIAKYAAANVAAMVIPGFALAYNANAARLQLKYNLDRKDYTKKEGSYEKLSDLKKKTSNTDVMDDLKNANPRLGHQKGKVNNCTFCTVAMEMRARGYDVQARSKAQGAVTEKLYSKMFEGFEMNYPLTKRLPKESRKDYVNRSYNVLCNKIESYGNGARGYVGIRYEKTSSGHAMYWKVDNGRVTFYDGQSGKVNPDKVFSMADPINHAYARLDNLQLKDGVTEAVVSKKSKGDTK